MQPSPGIHRSHLQLIISLGLMGLLLSILGGYAYYGVYPSTFLNGQIEVTELDSVDISLRE